MEHNSQTSTKKHIITIAGRPGSGKSTTAKEVAQQLKFDHFSSGDLFRALGKEQGIDVFRANQEPGVTEKLDELVDSKLREIGKHEDQLVIDSRTAWHWIPNSFKVFLDLDMKIAAQRILDEINEDRLASEKLHESPDEYAKMLRRRLEVERARYKALYNIDPYNTSNYDLVVDTSLNNVKQAVELVVNGFQGWIKN